MGFLSLRRRQIGSPLTRACLTRYVPSSGFRNLLTACSSSILVGLFHPTDIRGIRPPELSPRHEPWHLAGARCPPAVAAFRSRVLGFPLTGSWPPTGLCSRVELVHDRSGVTPAGQPMLSWTFSSLGCAARGDGPAFAVPPPVCFGGPVSRLHCWCWIPACLHSGVSLLRGRGLLSCESAFPF